MSGLYRRYKTGIRYTINIGDGLIHFGWVKNTFQGPWFFVLCGQPDEVRGAEEPCADQATCLECIGMIE